jgi:hypothetical protein
MTVLLDFETRSRCDLKAHGGRLYAEHPSTEAICAVLYDTESGDVMSWQLGEPCPVDPDTELGAHNASGFDRFIAARVWGPEFGHASWIDTSELARRAGLPGALDALGKRWLGLEKDKEASRFTKNLSTPRRPSGKKNPDAIPPEVWKTFSDAAKRARGVQPALTPDVRRKVIAYCASDVEIIATGWDRLEPFRADGVFGGWEAEVLRVDRIINDRGVAFDSDLARALLEADARNAEAAVLAAATAWGESPSDTRACAQSPAQFTAVLGIADAQKQTVEALLRDPSTDEPTRLLCVARQALASIAKGKLEAGLSHVSGDGQLRDNQRYYGAHTGRWSGRGMQLQNFPRPEDAYEKFGDDDIERLVDRAMAGERLVNGEIMVALRACLLGSAVCDFAGVEARATAWVAGDRAALDVFRAFDSGTGPDPYIVAAARGIFNIPCEQVTKDQRTSGKMAELSCFAGDTLVLTRRGWRPIAAVEGDDSLWDGVAWVSHRGLMHQGTREVVESFGVRATPDHPVWSGRADWCPFAALACNVVSLSRALASASASLPLQAFSVSPGVDSSRCWFAVDAELPSTRSLSQTFVRAARRAVTRALRKLRVGTSSDGSVTRASSRTTDIGAGCATVSLRSCSDAGTLSPRSGKIMAGAGSLCTSLGERIGRLFSRISSRFRGGITPRSTSTGSTTIGATSLATCASFRARSTRPTSEQFGSSRALSPSYENVYDIADAGPRHRFTILTDRGPLIVHNCGYQGGVGALERIAAKSGKDLRKLGVDPQDVVDGWRKLHKPIVKFWRDINAAFLRAADGHPCKVSCFDLKPSDDGRDVLIYLPSGRPIVYGDVQVSDGQYGPTATYQGGHFREHIYGGLLTENVIQAMCRDLLADAMVRAEDDGLCIVLTVHDELVSGVERQLAGEAARELKRIMMTLPGWAKGFPVGAKEHHGYRYRK